ncbi:MAG: hypothetical protein HOC91_05795 [Nitrospinaceae bacterium]|jgi:hypothetical protein|nr:hypothetical protein [Nitrospinaceae bacterium]MBT3433609.1 hypothetical protein [Nitrospinaceae bacterium]MBT3820291.1 hypothetical protein [Nitrospinaceae bacterium]MBT4093810.1 hypothetical protein [Nitrospinaceae bacterium]MBT4430011.1 hypothetical protein [Nitrospinaceae bacterium]
MKLDFMLTVAVAGFLATYCHMAFALTADRVGMVKLDFGKGLSMLLFGESYGGSPPYVLGFIAVHLNGIVFALFYATVVGPMMSGSNVVRGLIFGGILLIFSQCFFNPFITKHGFFAMKANPRAWQTAVVAHAIYGVILGWLSPIAS